MANVIQTKKKRDKKRKKEDGFEEFLLPQATSTPVDDLNIHLHKEATTGGGLCAKLVFFVLLTVLSTLIGLIITEHRGLTDLDTINTESAFAHIFDGWIDKMPDDHEETYSVEQHHEDEDDDVSHYSDQDKDETSDEHESSKVESDELLESEDEEDEPYQRSVDEDNEETQEEDEKVSETQEDEEKVSETIEASSEKDETLETNEDESLASAISEDEPEEDEEVFREEVSQRLLEKNHEASLEAQESQGASLVEDEEDEVVELEKIDISKFKLEEVEVVKEEENENSFPEDLVNEAGKEATNSEKPAVQESEFEDDNWSNKRSGANSVYDFSNITNVEDLKIREELDRAEDNLANE